MERTLPQHMGKRECQMLVWGAVAYFDDRYPAGLALTRLWNMADELRTIVRDITDTKMAIDAILDYQSRQAYSWE